MKLYDCLKNSKVRIIRDTTAPPDARVIQQEEIVTFHHIDGMYSFCYDQNDNIVHLPAWQEVELV